MKLVIDENIPMASEAFEPFGTVELVAGRTLTREQLADADVLIVRSVTRVDASLIEGTPIRFVGSATVGMDHVDVDYLKSKGIRVVSAAGSNARSVVEYVLSGLGEFCLAKKTSWEGKTLGIIGHGNIGSRLATRARALGMRVLVNDPPEEKINGQQQYVPLSTLLSESDYISVHVPYQKAGDFPTHHLISHEQLQAMKPGTLLFNTSRGEVLDNQAALAADHLEYILDVFEGEPRPNRDLVRRCFLATPHIAGYSYDGKINGTRMMVMALSRFLNRHIDFDPELEQPENPEIELEGESSFPGLQLAMVRSYPIREDHERLLSGMDLSEKEWGEYFDSLRKNYPRRREFSNYRISTMPEDRQLRGWLRVLHFQR